MSEQTDLSFDQRRALDELRWLIGEVVRLNREYVETADIVHPDNIGSEREAAFLQAIRFRLDEFDILQRATVQQPDRTAYGQHDVVIADPRVQPHRVLRNGQVHIAPRGVHAAIEVKSTLTSGSLLDALDHLAQLKGAPRCHTFGQYRAVIGDRTFPYVPICGGVFAYRSELRLSSITARVQTWARQRPHELWPNFIVVLNRGMVTWCDTAHGYPRVWPHAGDLTMRYEPGDPCSPLVGLVTTMETLRQGWQTPGTPFRMPPPHDHGSVGMKIGRAIMPPGVPTPAECDHECANCHYYGRLSFAEQQQNSDPESQSS